MISDILLFLWNNIGFFIGVAVGYMSIFLLGVVDYLFSKHSLPARRELEAAQAQVSGAKQQAKQITQGAEERFKRLDRCARELEPYVEQLARQRRRHERKVAELEALVVSLQQRRDALRGFKL